ncbi:HU family DNA-binding protein [Tahibacter amnicola]|uniref:HU family DNA-binding protein n=1 Tax=Tahibacter amnicola TaxID=2976241 RepID=A0ABY6BEN5_9GAMM|nr:HU family DNA-binding protein [Tahibacter amnicola]UXI66357.1 HU family DNA-binding protein [Tahibacter amnicola]
MNKQELVNAIAEDTGTTKAAAEAALNSFIAQVSKTLKNNESVVLAGFGTFEVRSRAARSGRNPQTGATIEIAASKVPAFKPGAALKKEVNG